MKSPEELVEYSDRLTKIFGYWPSFHDAEVIEFNLWRGHVEPERERYVFPVLTTKIHVWEMTDEVDAAGYFVLRHGTLVTLRFQGITHFEMKDFNYQNVILGLLIEENASAETPLDRLRIEFDGTFGIQTTFCCERVEVVEAEPWETPKPPS